MRRIKRYYLFIILAFFLGGCQEENVRLPSLIETYGKEDKIPFGGYVAFQKLRNSFVDNYIQSTYEPFFDTWNSNYTSTKSGKQSLYVLITKDLFLKYSDADAMLEYLSAGNDMFLSADYIDPVLLEKINCFTERSKEINSEMQGIMHTTSTQIKSPVGDTAFFNYFYFPFENYFSGYDLETTRVLGWNNDGKPNFIVMFIGAGRLYLHSAPRALGNYFLLRNQNNKYLDNLIGYFRAEPKLVFWDEYYKHQKLSKRKRKEGSGSGGGSGNNSGSGSGKDKDNDNKFSSFNVINQHEELKWAFWLGLILLLLFALFNMKRKQRLIPKIDPNKNTTVAFTETVGRLYLQKKNNKNISEKMITYFFDHIRNHYFLSTTKINYDFTLALARKSGLPVMQVETLFRTISSIQSSEEVEDFQLLSLNEQVQNFYKNKN